MERNDVSFSIPTWRREEIRSIGLAEEEALYMTSPYNLNDFKNNHQSVEYIFAPSEEPSEIRHFQARRHLNPKVSQEVALFTAFLYQILLHDNSFGTDRHPATEKNLDEKGGTKLLGAFKQKLLELNLCKLKGIPREFEAYYRNEVIKKIIFQYFGKCAYNTSLIELLLTTNDFLRFALELSVKAVLFEATLIATFADTVDFSEELRVFVGYFGYLFVSREGSMKQTEVRSRKLFSFEGGMLRTEHYLLKQGKEGQLFLHRKDINEKHSSPLPIQQIIPLKLNPPEKTKEVHHAKPKSANQLKERIRQLKAEAHKQPRDTTQKGGFFSCLPCFKKY